MVSQIYKNLPKIKKLSLRKHFNEKLQKKKIETLKKNFFQKF